MNEFKNLFSPIRLGPVEIKNRLYMTSHATNFDIPVPGEDGIFMPSERLLYYYAERAKGEVGLIMHQSEQIHPTADTGRPYAAIYDRRAIPGLSSIADAIHGHDCKIFMQLFHEGLNALNQMTMRPSISASQVPSLRAFGLVPKAMSHEDIKELQESYAVSAENSLEAGYDGVEIHSSHGYLPAQFLSPAYNKRSDEYGGPLRNRIRFLYEIIDLVRERVGHKIAVGVALSADELLPAGLTVRDSITIAHMLTTEKELDFLDVDVGVTPHTMDIMIAPWFLPPGYEIDYITPIKPAVQDTPLLGRVGRLADPYMAESLIASAKLDMVGGARAFIADPEIARKMHEGRLLDIRPCLGCNQFCIGRLSVGNPITCTVNPAVGYEKAWGAGTIKPAGTKKKILVIGAGPSGLEAARVAALRGHQVTIYEAGDEIGGAVRLAKILPGRSDIAAIIGWYENQLRNLGVTIKLRAEVTANQELVDYVLSEEKPDAVVVATGSKYVRDGLNGFSMSSIPGWEREIVSTPEDILEKKVVPGHRVLILDSEGFDAGPGLAEHLALKGHDVEMLTHSHTVALGLEPMLRFGHVHRRLHKAGVKISPHTFIKEIGENFVIAYNIYSNETRTIPADTVIMITSRASSNELYNIIKEKIKDTFLTGDAVAPRLIGYAIRDGHKTGRAV